MIAFNLHARRAGQCAILSSSRSFTLGSVGNLSGGGGRALNLTNMTEAQFEELDALGCAQYVLDQNEYGGSACGLWKLDKWTVAIDRGEGKVPVKVAGQMAAELIRRMR